MRQSNPWSVLLSILVLGSPALAAGPSSPPSEAEEKTTRPAAQTRTGGNETVSFVVSDTRVVLTPRNQETPIDWSGAALRAVVDPHTGELVSPPSTGGVTPPTLYPRMERALSTSDDRLQEIHLPDGTVMVDLEGLFMSVLRARVGGDGSVSLLHAVETPQRSPKPGPELSDRPPNEEDPSEEDR